MQTGKPSGAVDQAHFEAVSERVIDGMLLAAPDKFRGTASAEQVSAAIERGASPFGWSVRQLPLADGGEGLLDALGALGGTRETLMVEGPLGHPVEAVWLRVGGVAVIEMARASGLGGMVGGKVRPRFAGEQQITAAIYSLTTNKKPKLCFVRPGGQPVTSFDRSYEASLKRQRRAQPHVRQQHVT